MALFTGFPQGLSGKESTYNAADTGSILGGKDPHSSILAWESLWTEEPGRLQSMVSQKSNMTY